MNLQVNFILLLTMLFISQFTLAQKVIPLYDGKAAGSEDWTWSEAVSEQNQNTWNTKIVYNVVEPTLTAYIPPYYLATGTAVIIAPGGGYHALSIDSEGIEVAKYLQSKGVAAFVLKYRLVHCEGDPTQAFGDYKKAVENVNKLAPLALADGLTAVKYVRDNAEEYDIKTDQIGFMGFSAGGNLTMNVAYNASDESRPNFIAPIYTWDVGVIGEKIPEEKMPMFSVVAADDEIKLMPYCVEIYKKWTDADQPAELHIYEKGGHGFGMRTKNLPSDTWYERFDDWMDSQGYLEKLYGEGTATLEKIEPITAQKSESYSIKEINDLRYVSKKEVIVDSLQRLNLVLPEGIEKPPLLIWIGGGAWAYVNRHVEMDVAKAIAQHGIAVASVGHRLSTAEWIFPDRKEGVQHPAHVQDVAKACKWLIQHAEEYGYNKDNIFIGGFSSGAYIAAYLAMNPKYLEAEGLKIEQFKGIIPISGVYDIADYHNTFVNSANPHLATQHVEAVFGPTEAHFKAASQIYFLENLQLPMLLFSDRGTHRYTALLERKIREETDFTDFNVVHVHHLSHGDLWRHLARENSIYRALIVDFIGRLQA